MDHPCEVLGIVLLVTLSTPQLAAALFPGLWWRRGETLPHAADDLSRRRPVWSLLSEFYLDTELDDQDHARIASVLACSGYSAEQLEEIFYREAPPLAAVEPTQQRRRMGRLRRALARAEDPRAGRTLPGFRAHPWQVEGEAPVGGTAHEA